MQTHSSFERNAGRPQLLKIHWCKFEDSWEFSNYFPVKFVNFLKSRIILNLFYCFWMFVNTFPHVSRAHISKSKRCFNVKSSAYYFHMTTIIMADFQICISLPLIYFHFTQTPNCIYIHFLSIKKLKHKVW